MKTSLFDFELPPGRIATEPENPRDAARMLVIKNRALADSKVLQLPDFLNEGDVLVFNDTRVIPAQLHGRRGTAHIEVTLHKVLGGKAWQAFARPGKRLKTGDVIIFADDFSAIVQDKLESGEIDLQFECGDLQDCLKRYGTMPLPPYMKREVDVRDDKNYQTIYARRNGAVAAPTAGLHFTDRLFSLLKNKGVKWTFVTLHVGAGTFQPVKAEDTEDHRMHSEYAEISQEVADVINTAKKAGRRVVAIGTTSLRTLESSVDEKGRVNAFASETDIFITPGYKFKVVDALMTNFHLPRSTLFMLVSAFAGLDTMKEAYRHAIAENYRFYSYGDACLLTP